jgi:sigma-B regulation protein RsbU (phosphoserine phosphatase)
MNAVVQHPARTSSEKAAPRTLIADDQPDVVQALRILLKANGHQTEAASSPAAVLEALRGGSFDLLLMDLNYARDTTSGDEGLDLLDQIQAMDYTLPIVVMTAWGSTDLAVKAMQRGACDYIEKPWENARLLAKLQRPLEKRRSWRINEPAMTRELNLAREIQSELVLRGLPQLDGYEFSAEWQPLGAVSGDAFDVLPFGSAGVGFCIADAVGKGVPAALLASHVQATVRALASANHPPHELTGKVNAAVCDRVVHGRFVSFFYAHLAAQEHVLTYTCAGHPAPILVRTDGTWMRLSEGGPVLGEFDGRRFEQGCVQLASGDRLVLCTDGLLEAENSRGETFGDGQFLATLLQNRTCSAETLRNILMDGLRTHCGGRLNDDVTVLTLAVS